MTGLSKFHECMISCNRALRSHVFAEGVLDADKGAAGKASGSNKKAGKACCSVM